MKKYLIIILFLIYPVLSEAGISVCHDVNNNVTGFQLRGGQIPNCFWFDADQNVSQTEYDRVKNLLKTNPRKYLKIVSNTVQEKDTSEKTQVDVDETVALKVVESQAVDRLEVSNEDIITALIQVINARLSSNKITKQEIIDQIKTNKSLP